MEEQLISYNTALLAKEKGFILGIGWFGFDNLFYHNGKLTENHRGENPVACRQSLLQKWLRDVHNIHIEISHWTQQSTGETILPHCFQPFVNGDALNASIYKTYEEALEAGLVSALNLIN